MAEVIVHKYVEPDLKKLKKNENADCTTCMMCEKTRVMDEENGYLCKAALYDIKTLACYVPKEN
jgi:hypothetical protein